LGLIFGEVVEALREEKGPGLGEFDDDDYRDDNGEFGDERDEAVSCPSAKKDKSTEEPWRFFATYRNSVRLITLQAHSTSKLVFPNSQSGVGRKGIIIIAAPRIQNAGKTK